jgi:P27 family predicted phage terminase small subunit
LTSPEAPEWLTEAARAVWDRFPADVVAGADPDALAVYCCAVADHARAQQTLDQTGPVIRSERGGLVKNPMQMIKAENATTIRALSRQLGLSADKAPAPAESRGWRNQAATERTITALRRGGRLEEVDAAAAALARHLARALDSIDPGRNPAATASIARAQLQALRSLRGIDDTERDDPGISDLLAALSAPVGDETDAGPS